MPALAPTDHLAEITWLGSVETPEYSILWSEPKDRVELVWEGIAGSRHTGTTRPSCVRVKSQYPQGTEIRNVRQLTILSEEEMAQIAEAMGLSLAELDPARLGASMVVRGIADFSHIPPSSRLQGASGATLVVDMENRPCQIPGKSLEQVHPGKGKGFRSAAEGRRGVTAWVERPGTLAVGDALRLHIPDQPAWTGGA